jgi:hypothetical protein
MDNQVDKQMDKRVKEIWLKGLRGGTFLQGMHALKKTETDEQTTHCCLGVLCELFRDEFDAKWYPIDNGNGFVFDDGDNHFLPRRVMDWAGLESCDPRVVSGDEFYVTLSEMNDRGDSFEAIARVIEEQL